tara:strand:+ start:326 stop:595 length:270 start_codon:yes stop_codon:yes gene_type:complete
MKKVQLSNGRMVEYGSQKHINELDSILLQLDHFRKKIIGSNRKLRKERYTISKAIESIRHMKRKIEKENAKKLVVEDAFLEKIIMEILQ